MYNRLKKTVCLLLTLMLLFAQALQPVHSHQHAHAEEPALQRGTFQYAGMYNNQKDSTLDYAYSDDYFAGDARVYNPSLSTMSLCLEMSSWSSLDEESWVDKAANARELMTDIGFVDFAQNDFWNDVPTVESIGAVIAHKDLADSTLIALAVRGGGYFSEWGSNVLIGSESEHTGFATARDNVLSFLNEYISRCGISGRVKLWLVGFSRGGAVANMTAGYLNQHGLPAEATLVPADLYCYTIEAPQGIQTADAGADAEHSNIHNIINPNDIVPLVAPADWGFGRYNQTSHLLPTITTARYAEAQEQMLRHYDDVLKGVEVLNPDKAAYNIAEYAKTLEMKLNWLSFLPGGDPFLELKMVDNTHLPQSVMLVESVSALVEAAKSRELFHENIEADISTLLGELLGAHKGASLSDYIQELGAVLTENDYANLIHILEPIIQLNLKSFDERMNEVALRMRDVIPQPEGYNDIVGTFASLVDVIATMLVEDPQAVLNLVLSLSNTNMIQAHYAEVTMAWLRTEDPNFTDAPFTGLVPEAMRVVRVNCPVNLEVYDADGRLVASIVDSTASSLVEGIGCAVNPDGEMVLYLPADAAFDVRIIATGDGTVSCAVNEFNVVRGKHTYVVNYDAVPIVTGETLTAVIPQLPEDKLIDPAASGSSANYYLLDNTGEPLDPESILRGDQVNLFTVRATRNNEYGQVLGGGTYVGDSFAQLTAYPVSGGSFVGWYQDGNLVSTSATYRFAVTQDVTVVAHFAKADGYQVRFTSTTGGTVNNVNKVYPTGSTVMLSASAAEGYLFSGWSTTAGSIQYTGDHKAYLIVPECEATVTASFVEAGITCRGCKEVLPKGVTHQAPCYRERHFTCAPGYSRYTHQICPICREGYACLPGHGYASGECGRYVCDGCGEEIRITESHTTPCGHFACAADYVDAEHTACEHCGELLCNGGNHGLCALCSSGYLCQGGHGTDEGECSYVATHTCAGCGAEILITESHAAPCGTSGHWTCAANYNAADHATCAYCSALLCDGNNHNVCATCGNKLCNNGDHNACPTCGNKLCDGNNHSTCSTCGNALCDGSNHNACPTCGNKLCDGNNHSACSTCGNALCDGNNHNTCSTCGNALCNGNNHNACATCGNKLCNNDDHSACPTCGSALCDGNNHSACSTCGNALCDGSNHSACPICDNALCNGSNHNACPTCGSALCDGNNHNACATCGGTLCDGGDHSICPVCGSALCDGNSHSTCSTCGNALCNGNNHNACATCGGTLCDGGDHSICPVCGNAKCGSGNHSVCSICDSTYCNGMAHGYEYGQCGNLNTSALITCLKCGGSYAPYSPHLGACNKHYTCQTGTDYGDHARCDACSSYLCDGSNHGYCDLCGESLCLGGSHGTGEGQCGYVDPEGATAFRRKRTLTASTDRMLSHLAIAGIALLLPLRRKKKRS